MPDYKAMYFALFHAITDAAALLEQAQQHAEELYIESDEGERDACPD